MERAAERLKRKRKFEKSKEQDGFQEEIEILLILYTNENSYKSANYQEQYCYSQEISKCFKPFFPVLIELNRRL